MKVIIITTIKEIIKQRYLTLEAFGKLNFHFDYTYKVEIHWKTYVVFI